MEDETDVLLDQERWNQYGTARTQDIEKSPDQYIITECPYGRWEEQKALLKRLNPVEGRRILEVGCGLGDFSVWLAKQGAEVTATDIGPELVNAGIKLAQVNHVKCAFHRASIVGLPVGDGTQDFVVGLRVLHHLSKADVIIGLRECHRVLRSGGTALFCEPVENSKVFNFLQNLIPVGREGDIDYRPSLLQRKEWASYLSQVDDRAMTTRELLEAGNQVYRETRISPYGFLVRLVGLIGRSHRERLQAVDRTLFRFVPPLRHFCQVVVVEHVK